MPHCTPEQLALAALREPLPATDAAHLDTCTSCRAEMTALQRGVDLLAIPELAAVGPGAEPPPSVWAGIAAATDVSATPRPERVRAATASNPSAAGTRPVALDRRRVGRASRTRRPSRLAVLLTTAAATLAGAGIALGAVAVAQHGSSGTTVADTRLETLGASGTSGTAVVVQRSDRSLQLDVTLHGAVPRSGYYEVWLADPTLDRMVAVGVLRDGRGALELPPGLSVRSYPVVDVSVEPLDGNPAHSALSVARGRLS